jgi:hypothetical protein
MIGGRDSYERWKIKTSESIISDFFKPAQNPFLFAFHTQFSPRKSLKRPAPVLLFLLAVGSFGCELTTADNCNEVK